MIKKIFKLMCLGLFLILAVILFAGCGGSQQKQSNQQQENKLTVVRVSHQPEFESFLTYNAIKEGLDKKNGLELKMVYFDSGMPQIEALPANQWDVGAAGATPAIMAALRYGTYSIGIGDDESMANVVMVRPDSPILKVKGANPKYPDIYGSAELVKGKTILVTTVSGGHYCLSRYLKALGLTEADVKIQNLEQAQAVAAFESGAGDMVVLWAPFTYTGLRKGWKVVATAQQVDAIFPIIIMANKKFADEHPDLVVKFLDIYFQQIDKIKKEGKGLADLYKAFLNDWGGLDISKEDAAMDIELHPVYDLKEQLAMFDSSNGPSKMEKLMGDIAEFFASQGKFTMEEKDKVMKSGFITDKFIKELAKQKGLIK
ncbi:ABC transporter substrate-binding protein [Neomoorella humiferrea]|uniref:Putative aliphatic sulfonates-binding protein n=1 Tax=Neomoorella humiferrea TaxID=676965 RepID=A0A2T0AZ64_9FIRM|nr:ABC transporter substrate-binding protein [Moorella humiferrea]PRR76162.1 putative aliphatic sulfonates-binding protein precursor [Moorella humiferrea]